MAGYCIYRRLYCPNVQNMHMKPVFFFSWWKALLVVCVTACLNESLPWTCCPQSFVVFSGRLKGLRLWDQSKGSAILFNLIKTIQPPWSTDEWYLMSSPSPATRVIRLCGHRPYCMPALNCFWGPWLPQCAQPCGANGHPCPSWMPPVDERVQDSPLRADLSRYDHERQKGHNPSIRLRTYATKWETSVMYYVTGMYPLQVISTLYAWTIGIRMCFFISVYSLQSTGAAHQDVAHHFFFFFYHRLFHR